MQNPENQDWQRECTKCGKVKCPKVEKVAEWMRAATDDTFKMVEHFAKEDPTYPGIRSQAGLFSVFMEQHMVGWSRCLEGVCFDCQGKAFPDEEERLGDEDGIRFAHWRRWAFAAPPLQDQRERDAIRAEVLADVEATGEAGKAIADALRPPVTVRVRTEEAKEGKDVPCAWSRGGLAVTLLGEANLEKARADRGAGKEGVYPTQAWSITHLASGLAIAQSYDMPDDAVKAARTLLPLADWTLPMEQLMEAMKTNRAAMNAVAFERTRCAL